MYTKNPTVDRLNRYLPFDPGHDQIYEESASSFESFSIETKAFDYLKRAVPGARAIVLTGDAGHGKTHLCRRLIESFCLSEGLDKADREDQSRDIINNRCNGREQISANFEGSRTYFEYLRIFPSSLSKSLRNHSKKRLMTKNQITIVCANEGRLRAALTSNGRRTRRKENP